MSWTKAPEAPPPVFTLDGLAVSGISAELRSTERSTGAVAKLAANRDRCFEGPSPKAAGMIISADEAIQLLERPEASYRDVIRPYLTAADIADEPLQAPSRWVIDFGTMPLEAAARYPAALTIVRDRVLLDREKRSQAAYLPTWWQFARPRAAMRHVLLPLSRYSSAARHGKRLILCWSEPWTLGSDATEVFAFEDDYSMGVLCSRAHGAWAWAQASTLKGDLRYTPTSVFATFAWPDPTTSGQREDVADACLRLLARRTESCVAEQIGLTTLYNAMDDGAWADLKALHRELDVAVAACYGWPAAIAQDDAELVRRLTALNREITEGARPYAPFAHLGDT